VEEHAEFINPEHTATLHLARDLHLTLDNTERYPPGVDPDQESFWFDGRLVTQDSVNSDWREFGYALFKEAAAKAAEPPAQPRPEAPHLIGLQAAVTNGPRGVSSSVGSALTAAAAQRRRADQLLEADDAVGLRALAEPSNDPYVRRRLAGLYARRHDVQTLKDLGTFSKAACKALAQLLADDGAIEELCRQVVCGNGFARHILESRSIVGLADDERAHILKFGLSPNGTTVSERHVS